MPYVDGRHRYENEVAFFELMKSSGLCRHVILTASSPVVEREIGKLTQLLVHAVSTGMVFGAVERKDGRRHVHLLTTRSDARRIKDAHVGRGYGRATIEVPQEDDAEYRRVVRYVQRKWTSGGAGEFDIIFVTAQAA